MIHQALEHAVHVIELIGAAILILGFLESLFLLIKERIKVRDEHSFHDRMRDVRRRLGVYMLLGLEFLIAGDVIMTITNPTQDELIRVATLVAVRSAIGYFLGKELAHEHEAAAH